MTWRQVQRAEVGWLDLPATRLVFGVVLPMICFERLRSPPLLVFAGTICAALAWSVARGPSAGALATGALCVALVPCILGLLLVPAAPVGLVMAVHTGNAEMAGLSLLGLAPVPALVVYLRELTGHLGSPAFAWVLLVLVGALAPCAAGLGTAKVMQHGVALSLERIADEQVPFDDAVAGARRWSWATDWHPLAHAYGRATDYWGRGPWPEPGELSSNAHRTSRAHVALTGEPPELALERWARAD